MPTDARPLSLIQAVVDLQRQARRHQARNVGGSPIWEYDTYTITGSGDTTHTLSYLPYGINVVLLNGLGLVEGTDYSVDYTTGVVTVTATLTAGDVLHVRYVTTGDLKVAAIPPDTGNLLTEDEATFETGISSNWVRFAPSDATVTRQTSGGHTGSAFLRLTGPTTNAGSILAADMIRDIPIDSSLTYSMSGWLRSSGGSSPAITVFGYDSGGSIVSVGGPTVTASSGVWTYASATGFSLPAPTVKAHVRVRYESSGIGVVAGSMLDVDDLFFTAD